MNDSKTETEAKVFPSKIDWWVALLLLIAPGIHFPLGIWVINKGLTAFGIGLMVWGIVILVIILLMSFPCKYVVSKSHLTIHSGLFTNQVRLSSIEKIEPKRSWGATTALSTDRLELQLSDKTIRQISPKDKQGLIDSVSQSH